MWIVRLALRRPYTFVVMAMLIVILGVVAILRMPTDIFPNIDIPVISCVFNYTGLPPEEMEKRIVSNAERGLTTSVDDIEHIESQSLTGMGIIKLYLQPGASVDTALAEMTAMSSTMIRSMPPGTVPPSSSATARRAFPSSSSPSRVTRSASSRSSTSGRTSSATTSPPSTARSFRGPTAASSARS